MKCFTTLNLFTIMRAHSEKWNYYLLIFLFLLFNFVKQAEGAITLRLGLTVTADHPWTIAHERLAKMIAEKSKGNLIVNVFPNSQLGGSLELLNAVNIGKIEMATLSVNVVGNSAKPMEIVTLPFLFRDIDHAQGLLSGKFGEKLLKEGEKYGFVGLAFFPSEFNSFLNNKRPIHKLEDFKGLKVRTTGNPFQIATFKSLGSMPTPLPFAELYMALNQGVIDAAEAPPIFLHNTKLYQAAKYVTIIRISYSPGVIIMNSKKWNLLSGDLQKAITDSIHEVSESLIVDLKEREDLVVKEMKQFGTEVNYIKDLTPFKNASKTVFDVESKAIGGELTNVAYRVSYDTFNLKVVSAPEKGGDVFYKRTGDPYKKHHEPTDTKIENLYYAIWKIKVSKPKCSPQEQEKDFDPLRYQDRIVIFNLAPP